MAGTASYPHTFTTSTGNVPASYIDDNNDAIVGYINNREVTSGTLALRPAFGIAGRWYFANDTNGGTLYFDTGSAWVQAAAPKESASAGRVVGMGGIPNVASPTTQYDWAATQVTLWNPSTGGTVNLTNVGNITNNTSTAGPSANARDQAGAFSASSWVHFYFIWNGSTVATLSSASYPPTGPTLPSGYTHYAYAGAVRMNAASQLLSMVYRSSWGYYTTRQLAYNGVVSVETAVSLAALVPPNAMSTSMAIQINTGVATATEEIRLFTGQAFYAVAAAASSIDTSQVILPNVAQQIYHISTGSPAATLGYVLGFSNQNGGE